MSTTSSAFYRSALIAVFAFFTLLMGATTLSHAAIDVYDFSSARQEAQYRGLIDELRCPKCQNQNLAGSDAPIAQDLKQKTYDMIRDGRSDAEIRQYMQERYGDFISYNPPVRPSTWILWFFPPLVLIAMLGGWFWLNHSRSNTQQKRPVTARAIADSSLTTKEQLALDKLLASRTSKTSTENNATDIKMSDLNKNKPKKMIPKKTVSKKNKSKGQARDKGDSL